MNMERQRSFQVGVCTFDLEVFTNGTTFGAYLFVRYGADLEIVRGVHMLGTRFHNAWAAYQEALHMSRRIADEHACGDGMPHRGGVPLLQDSA
jgi:hypothetical protein